MENQAIKVPSQPDKVRPYRTVAVLGAGSWGTALAATLARRGIETRLWGRDSAVIDSINLLHENTKHLSGVLLPEEVVGLKDIKTAVDKVDAALIVVPSRSVRAISRQIGEIVGPDFPVAVCAKGIEEETGLLMSQVVEEELKCRPVGVVSGPTFARETALDHPTAATVAFPFRPHDRLVPFESPGVRLAVTLSTGSFRAYVSDDVIGVEIGGAVKNVIAIACGMMSGAGYAENTRAALITRGLDEMKLLAEALGGRRETVTGLSGVGDLTLTCSSPTSRNMSLGFQLGQGLPRSACFDGKPIVVEGEMNTKSVTDLANRLGVSMPICQAVNSILRHGAGIGETFAALWSRPIEAEPRAMQVLFDNPAKPVDFQQLSERIS